MVINIGAHKLVRIPWLSKKIYMEINITKLNRSVSFTWLWTIVFLHSEILGVASRTSCLVKVEHDLHALANSLLKFYIIYLHSEKKV